MSGSSPPHAQWLREVRVDGHQHDGAFEATTWARPIDILLVEDSAGDARLTIEALRDGKISNRLSLARDGAEALAFLRREGRHAHAPRPDLILLDLDLPIKDGRQVLTEIKADRDLQGIRVVILTVSRVEQDVLRAQQLAAWAYVTKPVDLRQFIDIVESIDDFGLTIAIFPRQPAPAV